MSDQNKKGSKLARYGGNSQLTKDEIKVFIHNAQNVLANAMANERIPALFTLKELMKGVIVPGRFTREEWATVLVSVAWDIYNAEDKQ